LVNWKDRRSGQGATYDHVDPNEGNDLGNLVVSCRGCNSRKGSRTPEQAGMALLDPGTLPPGPGLERARSVSNTDLVSNQNRSSYTPRTDHDPDPTRPDPTRKEEKREGRKRPARALPDDWAPSENCAKYAADRGVNLDHEADQFRAHAQANDRRLANWDQGFRQWLGNARPNGTAHTNGHHVAPQDVKVLNGLKLAERFEAEDAQRAQRTIGEIA
jgi:hypothetical protein